MKPDNVTPFEYRKFKMTLQDRVQAKAFYKQTSSYTQCLSRQVLSLSSGICPATQCLSGPESTLHAAFRAAWESCPSHQVRNPAEFLSLGQQRAPLPFGGIQPSPRQRQAPRNNSMEANWLPCWIAATIQAEHTENVPRTKLHPPQQGDLAAGTGLHVLQNPWILGRRRHTPENMDIRQPSNAKHLVYFLLSWVITGHSGL